MSEAKRQAALKAIEYVESDSIIGVGTGSTVAYFIEALGDMRERIRGAVSSSEQSTERLRAVGIEVFDLNSTGTLSLYVDGADECDPHKRLIKGGGAALTREKIIAEASTRFVCIVDPSKQVDVLGRFPLPVEVIPMARSLVAREILAMTRAQPVWRQDAAGRGIVTDNGNAILDIHGLAITDPVALEQAINQIPGVVSVGLFARRPADVVIVGGETPQVL
ncbi:ribose 5-phosphate isomerase [Lysobacter arseniciresistens ZS79]|uniref:Ribose-5-phosphate isomerase A n=1 Tax=Lysobacter arseniciresistens ZS79 TaxID=913325 RepID=A0A0A0F0C9_9GAMM|nr:ribose-5-phosphate isomerase RpiA [Lysobacter arseniciresistens]KGM55743.1 ribose 5-phosphate isomerase [Lysobacter arseniciresistens ZS79]